MDHHLFQLPPNIVTIRLEHIQIYKYLQVAGIALLVYDYSATFTREVNFIWKNEWTYVTAIFLTTRYLIFVDAGFTLFEEIAPNPSPGVCKNTFTVQAWLYVFGYTLSSAILIVRTCAIWDNNMGIAMFLILCVVGAVTGASYFLQKFLDSVVLGTSPSHSAFPGCFVTEASHIVWFGYLLILLFETVVFILTLFKSTQQGKFKSSPLVQTVYRDGVAFYAYILAISVVNMLVLNAVPPELQTGLSNIHRVLHAVLSERVILNIRNAGESNLVSSGIESGGPGSYLVSTLHFTDRNFVESYQPETHDITCDPISSGTISSL